MADPNVQAAKGDTAHLSEYRASLAMGLLPIALKSAHPSIIYRWNIEHIIAPMKVPSGAAIRKKLPLSEMWREGIWVDAWVWALFTLRNAMDVFVNAWTSLQENKPKILELKMLYDEALASPEKRLLLLTEFRLGIVGAEDVDHLLGSLNAAIARVQAELDEKEKGHVPGRT